MRDGLQAKIIKYYKFCFFDSVHPFNKCAIGFGQCNLFNESIHIKIERSVSLYTGIVSQGAGQIRFTTSCSTGDHHIICSVDIRTVSENCQFFFAQISTFTAVNILNGSLIAKLTYLPTASFFLQNLPALLLRVYGLKSTLNPCDLFLFSTVHKIGYSRNPADTLCDIPATANDE